MFGIGETELVIIVVFAFLLFGPDKLPGMGRTLGRMLRQFREASDGLTEVVQTSIMDPAAEELERSDKSPKQRRREAELEAQAQAQALDGTSEDVEAEGGETVEAAPEPPRRETFAERKARLMAERQAKERAEAEAAAAAATQAEAEQADTAETEAAVDATPTPEVAGPAAPAQEGPAPATRTAADLYAMGGQRSSRFRAAEEESTETTETALTASTAEEGEAPAGAPEDESDAKEEGGER